tara:strand:- start:653 stop:1693 length:1041 start_codon:yes stop_codon:yes gene_type:complete
MAFLDNSGDIILDAVLTELGRQRMSEAGGNTTIVKFGLGDDEINYGTYDLAHPSGSAYYDLEIMQTPIFQATTATNANINYGLLKITDTSLLYLPAIALNDGKMAADGVSISRYVNMIYLCTNSETHDIVLSKTTSGTGPSALAGTANALIAADTATPFVVFESGLDTFEIAATSENRASYLVTPGLVDSTFTISADTRFITRVGSLTAGSFLRNDALNKIEQNLSLGYTTAVGTSDNLENYNSFTVRGINDEITEPATSGNDNTISAIKGPRGTLGGLNFDVPAELKTIAGGTVSRLFSQYGVVNSNLFATGRKFDYIDTTVYVMGDFSGATLQIPVRVIRYHGT